jgi:hypothetical protein
LNTLPRDLREAAYAAYYCITIVWHLRHLVQERARAKARPRARPADRKPRRPKNDPPPDPTPDLVRRLEIVCEVMRPKFLALAPRWLDARVAPFRVPGLGTLVGPQQALTAHQAALELALYVCIVMQRANGRLDWESIPDPCDWSGEIAFEARHAVGLQDRLVIDRQANTITLDGTCYADLHPNAVRVVAALMDAGAVGGERKLSAKELLQRLPGCNHENTLRRWLDNLPTPVRKCVKGRPGVGRWLELPPLP